ncbi:acetyltransferase [Fodinibius sp. AD559]|uniref:acetyltransferase n=1 Tax=Fodinibius sp. AD559 TaxID=3424179 RepID=UPI004046A961
MSNTDQQYTERELAELVRKACIEAARDGFKDASMSGLCTEGAMEAAVSSIQELDLERIIPKK